MRSVALAVALLAHVLAWVAFLFLLLWPTYSGQSSTATAVNTEVVPGREPTSPAEPSAQTESYSASVVDVNGRGVIPILAVPLALTAVAVLAVIQLRSKPKLGMGLLWSSTILAVIFSLLGALSVGLFYFPAALAMILASVVGSLSATSKPAATPTA